MRRHHWLAAGILAIGVTPLLRAQEADPLKAVLAAPILKPGQPLEEVELFCESRIPTVPKLTTVEEWNRYADRSRRQTLDRVIFRGEAVRWKQAPTHVEWQGSIPGGPGYRIRKLRYEVLPGVWAPALLYEPEKLDDRVPVVLNVNGHDADGKAASYKQLRCINLAKRGMLALNAEWFGMGQLRTPGFQHGLINAIDLCGTSGIATHYLALKRGLDVLLSLEHADSSRVAVTGLSGGGWQTIVISGLDPRVTLANPVAGYSSYLTRVRNHSDLGDSEQTPCDLATVTDYAQLTAMRAPRPTLLTFNAQDDCCFRADHALPPLLDAAGPVFKLFGKERNLQTHVNTDPGTHNYLLDNRQAFYRMVGEHFYAGKTFDAKEIPSEAELKTKDRLQVDLPSSNLDFTTLARNLSAELPRDGDLPTEILRAGAWQRSRRGKLRSLVHAHDFPVTAETTGTETVGGSAVTRWKLRLGEAWTVPAVELAPSSPSGTVLRIGDDGRGALSERARAYLTAGKRVVALDPFHLGESQTQPPGRAYLWPLLVGAVGERPVGIQASQVGAVARWLAGRKLGPVTLDASGPRSSLAALVAAGLEEKAIQGVELRGSLGSLKEAIERQTAYASAPEIFCFGLLEAFDIRQLAALSAPRPVRLVAPSERARKELAGLSGWYRTFGVTHDPLQ
jgi:dienelactone hydrolase